jgi:hypothetical protein
MKEYKCNECEISFGRLSDTLRHLKTHKHQNKVYKNAEQIDVANAIIEYLESNTVSGEKGLRIDSPGGTGKTYTTTSILQYYDNVVYLGPTHKSITVLRNSIPSHQQKKCRTFHSYFGWSQDVDENNNLFDIWEPVLIQKDTIFILDEISMMSNSISSLFKHFIYDKHKFIMMGDKQQLPPIESKTDPELPANVELLKNPNKDLSLMFMFKCIDLKLITNVRASNDDLVEYIKKIRSFTEKNKTVYLEKNCKFSKAWFKNEKNLFSDYIFLAFKNKTKDYYNETVRNIISSNNDEIDEIDEIDEFIIGDKLILEESIFKKDDLESPECNPKINGTRYTIKNIETKTIVLGSIKMKQFILHTTSGNILYRISKNSRDAFNAYWKKLEHKIKIENKIDKCLDNCCKKHKCITDEMVQKNKALRKEQFRDLRKYKQECDYKLSFCFCSTTHKAQGSSYDTVFIISNDFLSGYNTNKLKYTAVSRAKNTLNIL